MNRSPIELYLALATIVVVTLGYALVARGGAPAPGSAVGLTLAVIGFLLMLATEVLYSLRKRWPNFNLWPMSAWLKMHIFTGLVGPYLALLHAAWRFNGLAGILMLCTVVVVISGLVGRYIYTAVPRSLDDTVLEVVEIEARLEELGVSDEAETLEARREELLGELRRWESARRWLSLWHMLHVPLTGVLFALAGFHIFGALYYSTFLR
jgi:hypothetical protein